MGGLQRLFTRLIPIVMLVCFICFGITTAFNPINKNNNLTYLTKETIQLNNNQELTQYNFDAITYMENIKIDNVLEALNNTIDIETYNRTFDRFNEIWGNGYQIGDILNTIANAILLTINTLLIGINIILVPIRLIAGLILTGLSIVGVNISQGYVIIPFLKIILTKLNIRLINPTAAEEQYINNLSNTTWEIIYVPTAEEFKKVAATTLGVAQWSYNINFQATSKSSGITKNFSQISIKANLFGNLSIGYRFKGTNNYVTIWNNGNWTNDDFYQKFTITSNNMTDEDIALFRASYLMTSMVTQVQNRQIEQNDQKSPIEETPIETPIEEEKKKLAYCFA